MITGSSWGCEQIQPRIQVAVSLVLPRKGVVDIVQMYLAANGDGNSRYEHGWFVVKRLRIGNVVVRRKNFLHMPQPMQQSALINNQVAIAVKNLQSPALHLIQPPDSDS